MKSHLLPKLYIFYYSKREKRLEFKSTKTHIFWVTHQQSKEEKWKSKWLDQMTLKSAKALDWELKGAKFLTKKNII